MNNVGYPSINSRLAELGIIANHKQAEWSYVTFAFDATEVRLLGVTPAARTATRVAARVAVRQRRRHIGRSASRRIEGPCDRTVDVVRRGDRSRGECMRGWYR